MKFCRFMQSKIEVLLGTKTATKTFHARLLLFLDPSEFKESNYYNISNTRQRNYFIFIQLKMTMSAYTVMDSVNKYRNGVLVGNHVEDRFGKDLELKGPTNINLHDCKCTTKETHSLDCSLYRKHPIITQQSEKNNTFYQTAKNITQSQYQRPQNQSTYNIFFNREVNKKVPILQNAPKKEERQIKQTQQYANTRYYLANKFVKDGVSNQSEAEAQINARLLQQGLKEQIPDILTGQIWKGNQVHAPSCKKEQSGQTGYNQQRVAKTVTSPVERTNVNPYSATSLIKPQIEKFDEIQYKRFVLPTDKGQERDILLGHGLHINQFHRRQLTSTYDLSFNQQVKPQTQVNSFYNPDYTVSAKKFHHDTLYEKTYQQKIPEYSDQSLLGKQKVGRPYDPYTKTFDYKHLKNQYLRSRD